jgi:hypothetical protein
MLAGNTEHAGAKVGLGDEAALIAARIGTNGGVLAGHAVLT